MSEEKKKDNLIWWKLGGIALFIAITCAIAYNRGYKSGYAYAREERIKQEAAAAKELEERKRKTYWRTSSSYVIHNSSCRWYNNSSGRFVEYEAEGRDCKVCGGRGKQ
jgi:hypothetical protein